MAHLPSFSIVELKLRERLRPSLGSKRIPIMQGWAHPLDAKRAFRALQKAYPSRTLVLED